MRLRQLFETAHHKATVAFCFGRFNPAHQGHAKVWEAVKHAGQHWYIGTNPSTIGPNDPLSFDIKTAWMEAIDPSVRGHIIGEKSIVTLASKIYQQVGDGATVAYVTDSQDWAWSGKLLQQYNGKKSEHGYFNFANIIHVESPRVSSATALRNAARAGDEQAFYQASGTDPNLKVHGKSYFETVAEACGLHPEKVKRVKKEKAVAETKKSLRNSNPCWKGYHPVGTKKKAGKTVPNCVPTNEDSNSVKYANKVIRDMRAKDFINEDIGADLKRMDDESVISAIKGGMSLPGISQNKSNGSSYQQYRFGIAMAAADGKNTFTTPAAGAIAGDPLLSVFTDEEYDIIKQAAKETMAGPIKKLSDMRSRETHDTNKQSVVAIPKKNKYGI